MTIANWDFSVLPGLTLFGPGFGLPIAVMSALIEEPFYRLAGVRSHSLRWSLRTNTIAYFWSCGLLPFTCLFGTGHSPDIVPFLIFTFLAVPVLLHAKFFYLLKHTRMPDGGLKWVLMGNAVSFSTAFALFFSLPLIRSAFPGWAQELHPWQQILHLFSALPAILTLGLAALAPFGEEKVACEKISVAEIGHKTEVQPVHPAPDPRK